MELSIQKLQPTTNKHLNNIGHKNSTSHRLPVGLLRIVASFTCSWLVNRDGSVDAELSYHECQFKLENVSRTGIVQWKNLTIFLPISRISRGVLQDYLDYLPYSCFVTEFG
jgi:hypothetical protein